VDAVGQWREAANRLAMVFLMISAVTKAAREADI
jgi:hypothetical protein